MLIVRRDGLTRESRTSTDSAAHRAPCRELDCFSFRLPRRHSRTPVDAPALSALRSVAAGLGLSRCWHGSDRIVSLDAGERSDQRRAAQTPFEPPVVFVAGVIAIPLSQAPLDLSRDGSRQARQGADELRHGIRSQVTCQIDDVDPAGTRVAEQVCPGDPGIGISKYEA